MNDIRRHYFDAEAHAIPDRDSVLLPAVAAFTTAAGFTDPLTTIYITTEPQPFMGLWLALLCAVQIGRFGFDREFGTLVRRKAAEPVDGAPLAAGLATLLKQLHPTVTADWLAYMGQYIRTSLFAAVGAAKPAAAPPEATLLLLLVQHVAGVARIADSVVHAHLPPYLFETIGAV